MIKKNLIYKIITSSVLFYGSALTDEYKAHTNTVWDFCYPGDVWVEGKIGFFHPDNSKFSRIYSNGPIFGGEVTARLFDPFAAWGSVGSFSRRGSSIGLGTPTTLRIVPVALGLKYIYTVGCTDLYVGIGGQFTNLRINDESPYVIQHISQWNWGGIAKVGCILNLSNKGFIDFFSEYSQLEMQFRKTKHDAVTRQRADLCGWTVGFGFGYRFCK